MKNPEKLFQLISSISGYILTLVAMHWVAEQHGTTITQETIGSMCLVQMLLIASSFTVVDVYMLFIDPLFQEEK